MKFQDVVSGIVTKGPRRRCRHQAVNAGIFTGGKDQLHNPPVFHIHHEVLHGADGLALIIFDRHPDDIAGFKRVIQLVHPYLRVVLTDVSGLICWRIVCFVLGQRGECHD